MSKEFVSHGFEEHVFKNNDNKRKLFIMNHNNNYYINKKKEDFVLIKKRKFSEIDDNEDTSLNEEINIVYKKPSALNSSISYYIIKNTCREYKLRSLVSKEKKYFEELCKNFKIENNKNLKKMTIKFANDLKKTKCSWAANDTRDNNYYFKKIIDAQRIKINFNNLPFSLTDINIDNMDYNLKEHNNLRNLPNTMKNINLNINFTDTYDRQKKIIILKIIKNFINYGAQGVKILKIDNFIVSECFLNNRRKNISHSFKDYNSTKYKIKITNIKHISNHQIDGIIKMTKYYQNTIISMKNSVTKNIKYLFKSNGDS
jgi:hypothetical protein